MYNVLFVVCTVAAEASASDRWHACRVPSLFYAHTCRFVFHVCPKLVHMPNCRVCEQRGIVTDAWPWGHICWRCEHERIRLRLEARLRRRLRRRSIEVLGGVQVTLSRSTVLFSQYSAGCRLQGCGPSGAQCGLQVCRLQSCNPAGCEGAGLVARAAG